MASTKSSSSAIQQFRSLSIISKPILKQQNSYSLTNKVEIVEKSNDNLKIFDNKQRVLTEVIHQATSTKNLIKMSANENLKTVTNNLYNFVDPNKVHLFVKAGQDSRSQGACPFCQDVFMQLLIKADENKFNFDVITINMDNPPKEFKELSIKPPVLFHSMNDVSEASPNVAILSDVDEIAEHLDKLFKNKQLSVVNEEAKSAFLNVFSKFSHFIRDVTTQASLEAELDRINKYLAKCQADGRKFLCGDYLTKLDCSLLPRLQHIRIASEGIKRYKIPERLVNLWRYMDNAYKSDAFQKSCPSDREIIWHWSKTNTNNKEFLQILQETPYKTLQIPENIQI